MNTENTKIKTSFTPVRIAGVAFGIATIWNVYWVISKINLDTPFLTVYSSIFLLATIILSISSILAIINNWFSKNTELQKIDENEIPPTVAVIIPTHGEAIDIVLNTLHSAATQNWRKGSRIIIVSDDLNNPDLRFSINKYKEEYKESNIIYFNPHKKGSPHRIGEAKSGNLNSALEYIIKKFPYVQFVETRDADDLVGDKDFLSYCVNHLLNNSEVSFVQTIKECNTHPGDPFCNNESVFYKSTMPARNAVNSAFPCGSGLVWRMSELKRLKGFPAWNLVEDLQSGYEILRIGGVGSYLPIIGAVGQIAPEDIANFYKQRGTWALDTLRLFYYKNPLFTKGLNIWQKLQFLELQLSYIFGASLILFVASLALSLVLNIYPIIDNSINYLIHFAFYASTMEIFNIVKSQKISYREQIRARQIWMGLMPVFITAVILAIYHGKNSKPSYQVTRKYHKIAWYWKETLVQKTIVATLLFSIIYNILTSTPSEILTSSVAIFWSLFFIFNLSQTIKNSWHGIDIKEKVSNLMPSVDFTPIINRTVNAVRIALF